MGSEHNGEDYFEILIVFIPRLVDFRLVFKYLRANISAASI